MDGQAQSVSADARAALAGIFNGMAAALRPRVVMPFAEYLRGAWSVTEPGKTMRGNFHIDMLAEYLTAVSLGQIRNLIVNIPPRWQKSTIITVDWPTWEWGPLGHPERRYLCVSHDETLSTMHNVSRRNIIESEWYAKEWGSERRLASGELDPGRLLIASDQNQKTFIENTRRGRMMVASAKGSATGKGGDCMIFDDFINPKMAESDAERNAALENFKGTYSSRLDDVKTGAMIVVEQRLHTKDFTNHLLKEVGGFEHVVIPLIAREGCRRWVFPISKKVVELDAGAPIWPERFPIEECDKLKRGAGTRGFAAQYEQNPTDEKGSILKRHNWRFYDGEQLTAKDATGQTLLQRFDELIQSWDCTFKDTDGTDYVVGQVWARKGADRFLLDQIRERLTVTGTMAAMRSMTTKWPRASAKLVEDAANGPAVVQLLCREIAGLLLVKPQGGKVVRARAVAPIQESGNIFLPNPETAPWVPDFIERAAQFPDVDHDDEIDALTQANIYFTADDQPRLTIL